MYRMMIVDDEERIANSIYDLMDERFDFELYRCYSAMAALDVIRTMRFDIVITDIAMPGMSGLELLNKVQAIWPKCHFLILTAYDSFDYAYETLRHDRVDYLLKIESYDTICQCVERKLQDIQKDIRHFLQLQDKLNDAEKEKEDALIEKMKKRMEMLDNRCRQEGKRLFEARYYGSAALKDILENSDEFSDLVEPDEDGAHPGALRENEEAGQ